MIVLVQDCAKEAQAAVIAVAIGCKCCELPAGLPAIYDVNDYSLKYGLEALQMVLNSPLGASAKPLLDNEETKEFAASNFGLSTYTTEKNRTMPYYTIAKDGYALLAMNYTGRRAMQLKLAYIAAFNAMAAFDMQHQQSLCQRMQVLIA